MATYTQNSKIIAVTAASGVNGFTGAVVAQNAAVVTAVTTAMAVTGYVANTLNISPAVLSVDTTSAIFQLYQTITYTVAS